MKRFFQYGTIALLVFALSCGMTGSVFAHKAPEKSAQRDSVLRATAAIDAQFTGQLCALRETDGLGRMPAEPEQAPAKAELLPAKAPLDSSTISATRETLSESRLSRKGSGRALPAKDSLCAIAEDETPEESERVEAQEPVTTQAPVAAEVSSSGQAIADFAMQFLGCAYVYGGSSPSGFDCSGLVYYVYGSFGYCLNRGATGQLQNGREVAFEELRPGDLVFFGYGSRADHVGIYLGNGQFIHAENSGTGVVISSLVEGYYVGRYLTARRIVE